MFAFWIVLTVGPVVVGKGAGQESATIAVARDTVAMLMVAVTVLRYFLTRSRLVVCAA